MEQFCVIKMKRFPYREFESSTGPLSNEAAADLCKKLNDEEEEYRPRLFFYEVKPLESPTL